MLLTCLAAISFSMPCELARPATPEPQAFIMGAALGKHEMLVAMRFTPSTPTFGPVIAWADRARRSKRKEALIKAAEPDEDLPIVAAAYAPAPARGLSALARQSLGKRYDAKKLYVLADGNEDMRCVLKNQRLMRAIEKIRDQYGRAVVVDSAYRSPTHNRRVRGARQSLHMRCAAVDIEVPGVGKEALRAFVRRLPEVGGVGIYRSGSIHIDTGTVRNWDWRRKKGAKK